MLDRISHLPLSSVIDVLDALHCGAALVNRTGWVVHANPPLFCEMMGRSRAEIVGNEVAGFYTDIADVARVRESYANFDHPTEFEFHLQRPDGARVSSCSRLAPPCPCRWMICGWLRSSTSHHRSRRNRSCSTITNLWCR